MEIEVQNYKHVDLLKVAGRIDSSNASELESAFSSLTGSGRYQLVVDLSGVEYMSSAGLRALVGTLRECKNNKGNLVIAQPSERMQEVLNLAGLDAVFNMYGDPLAAVGSF